MNLIQIKPEDYDLESTKAKQISDMFVPMLDKMTQLEDEYNTIIKKEITPEVCKEAKTLKTKYVKVRTGTAAIHKDLKAFYLNGGRFVDGWKNTQKMASEGIENKLLSIEKHFENIEKERVDKLRIERETELLKYNPESIPALLGNMSLELWDSFILGVKTSYEAKIEAEKQAELDRIAQQKEEEEERERVRKENEKLRIEAEERELKFKAEREKAISIQKEKDEKLRLEREKEKKIRLEKEKKLRIEAESKEKLRLKKETALRLENEAKLKKEREERAKIEAALKAKEEAELKARQEKEAQIQAELSKGDSAKVKDLLNDLKELQSKYSFESSKNKKMYNNVQILIAKIINHIGK